MGRNSSNQFVRVTLPVLGFQVQLRQPPAQEITLPGDTDDGRTGTDLAYQNEARHAVGVALKQQQLSSAIAAVQRCVFLRLSMPFRLRGRP